MSIAHFIILFFPFLVPWKAGFPKFIFSTSNPDPWISAWFLINLDNLATQHSTCGIAYNSPSMELDNNLVNRPNIVPPTQTLDNKFPGSLFSPSLHWPFPNYNFIFCWILQFSANLVFGIRPQTTSTVFYHHFQLATLLSLMSLTAGITSLWSQKVVLSELPTGLKLLWNWILFFIHSSYAIFFEFSPLFMPPKPLLLWPWQPRSDLPWL